MLINLNIRNNPYWYSILLSEGFFINKSNKYDILITDFSNKIPKLYNEKSVIVADYKNIHLLSRDCKFIKSIEYDLNKSNFSYTIDKIDKVRIDIYQRDKVFFIIYNFDIKILSFNKQVKKKIILNYSDDDFCFETLNKVDKNNVRKILKSILKVSAKLLNKKLFYIWKYPAKFSNVFNFRIDVDPERNRSEDEAMYNIKQTLSSFEGYADFTTYAINFYRRHPDYEQFLNLFNNKYDLVSHNYLHINLPTYNHSYRNVLKSFNLLKKNNFITNIFVSPEYFYYDNLCNIVKKLNIKYTSSLGYDFKSFPYRTVHNNLLNSSIEIPYQPLVYNKFRQGKKNNITYYYEKLIKRIKNDESQTFLLYDHPNILSKHPYIIENILNLIDDLNLWKTTLTNFSNWLSFRESIIKSIKINLNDNLLKSDYLNTSNYNVSLAIEDCKENILFLKSLGNEVNLCNDTYEITNQNYVNDLDFNSIGDTISYRKEKNINFLNNYKHFKKILMGYYLYYKLKTNI